MVARRLVSPWIRCRVRTVAPRTDCHDDGGTGSMNILTHLRLRTKLAMLLGLAVLGMVASIAVGASLIYQRMLDGRIAQLSAGLDTTLSLAKGLELQVAAHRITREQAMDQMRDIVHL